MFNISKQPNFKKINSYNSKIVEVKTTILYCITFTL